MSDYSKTLYNNVENIEQFEIDDGIDNEIEKDFSNGLISKIDLFCLERMSETGFIAKTITGKLNDEIISETVLSLSDDFSEKVIKRCSDYLLRKISNKNLQFFFGENIWQNIELIKKLVAQNGPDVLSDLSTWNNLNISNEDTKNLLISMQLKTIFFTTNSKEMSSDSSEKEMVDFIMKEFKIKDVSFAQSILELVNLLKPDLGFVGGTLDNSGDDELLKLVKNKDVGDDIVWGDYSGKEISWVIVKKRTYTCELLSRNIITELPYVSNTGEDLNSYLNKIFVKIIDNKEHPCIVNIGLPSIEQVEQYMTAFYNNRPSKYWIMGGNEIVEETGNTIRVNGKKGGRYGVRPYMCINI